MSVPRMHADDLERLADLTAQRVGSRSAPAAVPLLDAKAAAELLGVPASWVLAEARVDRIPHIRLGKYVRFETDQLEAWWRSRARGPWRSDSIVATSARASEAGARPASAGSDAP
jgi:excisionase family DNA binding protein